MLTPGLYVLIASPRVVAPPGTPRLPLVPATAAIEDGLGDGVAVTDVVRLEVIDAVIYERMGGPYTLVGFPDPVDLAGGQLPIVFDPGRGDETIARFPNGVDHNDAAADFGSSASTPGAAN